MKPLVIVVGVMVVVFVVVFLPHWWGVGNDVAPFTLSLCMRTHQLKRLRVRTSKGPPLDIGVCTSNLLAFREAVGANKFWLSEGTALGVVRDNNFIPWDDDVDVGMWLRDKHEFLSTALPRLRAVGFSVSEVRQRGSFLCLWRRGEKIDVDFVDETGVGPCMACQTSIAQCTSCAPMLPYLKPLATVRFLDHDWKVPQEGYFEYVYGPDWRTPCRTK